METPQETEIVKVKLYTKGEIDFYVCKKLPLSENGECKLDPDEVCKLYVKNETREYSPEFQSGACTNTSVLINDHRYSNTSKTRKKSLLEEALTANYSTSTEKPANSDNDSISIYIIHQCDICYEKFPSEPILKVHKEQHRDDDHLKTLVCPVCGLAAPDTQHMRIHLKSHPKPKKYGCGICDARFNWRSSVYIHHKRIHQGIPDPPAPVKEKRHECEKCSSKFRSVSQLKMHLRTHTGEKPYKCEVCFRGFAVKTTLELHERTHTGEKPFQCELCGQLFTCASGLQRHHLLHIGVRDFACDTCGLKFVDKHRLRRHIMRHTKQLLHDCMLCGRQFLDKSTLRKHTKLHEMNNYICSICSKGFDSKEMLNNHVEYHTASKPFVCSTCGKGFTDKQLLASHEKCHSKITPYQCDICGKRYTWRSSLGYHQRKHLAQFEFMENEVESE